MCSSISAIVGADCRINLRHSSGGGQELQGGNRQITIWRRLTQWIMGQRPAGDRASGRSRRRQSGPAQCSSSLQHGSSGGLELQGGRPSELDSVANLVETEARPSGV
jgi:hypothetical protein